MLAVAITGAALAAPDELAVAWHGDFLTHPGMAARAAVAPRPWLRVEGEIGGWWHPHNLVALYGRAGPAVRWEGPRHGTWGGFVHAGAMHGFWADPVYVVEGEDVRRALLAGRSWWTVASGLELGRATPDGRVDGWFVRPQVGLRIPTFHGYGVDLAVEAGVRFGGAS